MTNPTLNDLSIFELIEMKMAIFSTKAIHEIALDMDRSYNDIKYAYFNDTCFLCQFGKSVVKDINYYKCDYCPWILFYRVVCFHYSLNYDDSIYSIIRLNDWIKKIDSHIKLRTNYEK